MAGMSTSILFFYKPKSSREALWLSSATCFPTDSPSLYMDSWV